MNYFDYMNKRSGFTPDSTTNETDTLVDTIPPKKPDNSYFDLMNKMTGFSPDTMEEEVEEPEAITPEQPEPIIPETPEMPQAIAPEMLETPPSAQPEKKWGKLPASHPDRWQYMEVGDPPRLMMFYNSDPNLEGDLSKAPIPEPPPPPTIEIKEPEVITGKIAPKQDLIPPAMPSYGAFAPPVQIARPKVKEKITEPEAQLYSEETKQQQETTSKIGLPEAMVRSFGAGAADLALNIARTPQTASEIYLSLNNLTNRAINAGIKKITGKETGPIPEIPLENIPEILKLNEKAWDTKAVRNFSESQKKAIQEATNSKSVIDNLTSGNFSEAGKSLGVQAAAQVPLILAMIAGGAVGAPAKVLGGLAGATQSSSDMDQYWKDVEKGIAKQTPENAAVNALFNGAIETLGETYVTGNIIEDAMKVISKKTSENVAKKAVGNAVGSVVGRMIKTGGAEATEEMIVNYSQAVMDKIFGKRDVTLQQAIKEGIEGGIIGFFTSAGTTGPLSGIAESKSIEQEPQITEMTEEKAGKVPITPKEEYGTLSDFGMDFEELNSLPEDDQLEIIRQLSPEEQNQIFERQTAETEIPTEAQKGTIEEVEQQAKEAISPKPKVTEADLPRGETVTEPVEKQPVPAPEKMSPAEENEVKKEVDAVPRDDATEKKEINQVNVNPSEGQKEAGNYRKAHIKRDGFDISLENPAGSTRSGTDPTGKKWSQKINHDYGYIKGTKGADAFRDAESTDQVDVFIKPNSSESRPVYIVNQVDPGSGKFDEHKVMMGFDSEAEAKKAYLSNYEKGWKGLGSIVEMPMDEFKEWVYTDATEKPVPKKPISKEKPSAKETGETVGETGRKEGTYGGEEGRIRIRDTEKYGLETKTGKDIKTPKGVTAEVSNIPKKANLKNPNVYEPVLDLNKKPTGWIRPKNNKSILIDPESRKQVVFKAQKPGEATAKAKTNTAASGYAINNPIIQEEKQAVTEQVRERLGIEPETKEMEREPAGKVSREAPVSPTRPTTGKTAATKEKKKEITGEKGETAGKKPPVAEGSEQALEPEIKKESKEKPKFAKSEKGIPERKVTEEEKELTDIVYSSAGKESKYGTIKIVKDISQDSELGTIGKAVEETTGKKVVFIKTENRSLKPTLGFTLDGLSIPGETEGKFKDTIFVNVDSKRPLMWTAYHEFGHFLDANPNYSKRFWKAVNLTDEGMAELAKEGQSEFTADIIGEMMSRQEFWENLAKQGRTPTQKIMQEFLRIINKIRNSVRNIITSKQIPDEQIPQYESLLTDVTTARDELARIYSDYRKKSGKEVRDIPAKMSATIRGEKAVFAKRKPKKGPAQLPKREKNIRLFEKVEQRKLSDLNNVSQKALEAEKILDKQKEDVRNKFNKSIYEKLSSAEAFLGEKIWDRIYYAKKLLGKTAEALSVIGKINATKGYSASGKMQYESAEEKITKNLPYYLEESFNNFLQAKRISEIEEVKGEGEIKHTGGMTKEQADAFINDVENKFSKSDALAIKIAAGRYWNAMHDQLKQYYDKGIITKDLYKKLKTEGRYYSPRRFLQHIDPEKRITTPKGKKISVRESGIQSLKEGSEEAMVNNWRLLLSETIIRTQSRIFKNEAAKALGKFVENNPDNMFGGEIEQPAGKEMDLIDVEGIVDNLQGELLKLQGDLANATTGAQTFNIENKIDENAAKIDRWGRRIQAAKSQGKETVFIEYGKQPELPRDTERIYFMEDGEVNAVLVPKKFADSWNQQEVTIERSYAEFLNFIFGGAFVRPFATGTFAPEFALTNIPRDMALQWIATQEYSKAAPVALIQNIDNFRRVFKDAWTSTGRYEDYVKQGGGMDFLNEQGAILRKDPTAAITPTSSRNKKVIEALNFLQGFSERLTRLALREQALKNGKTPEEATQIAREYLDFSQGGSFVKAADNLIPYLNASVQGTRSVVRSAKEDPLGFAIKSGQLLMMGAALALAARTFRDDESEEISEREKVSRWNFPLGIDYKNKYGEENHIYFSIPKDQSSRIFATLGEVMMERWGTKTIDSKTAWDRIRMAFDDMSPLDIIGLLPPVPSALIGYGLNVNFWKEDKIWKGRKVSPYKEVYEGRTPKAYVDLAKKLNDIGIDLSPERMHQSLQQVLPKSLLSSAMGGAYEQITSALSKEDRQELNRMTYEHWSKLPFIRKYVRATYPTKTDYEKLTEQAVNYGIPLKDKEGKQKSETMIKHEIEKKELQLNDIRQEHDNEAMIVSEMLLTGKNVDAYKRFLEIKDKAEKEIAEYYKSNKYLTGKELEKKVKDELDRIDKKIQKRIEKNDNKKIYRDLYK